MIFQHTWEQVVRGEKTQTRRLKKPEECCLTYPWMWNPSKQTFAWNDSKVPPPITKVYHTSPFDDERAKWQVGKTYAVQPGRGKAAIGRIKITGIRLEDVRKISDEDVIAEGFKYYWQFFEVWTDMHDKPVLTIRKKCRKGDYEGDLTWHEILRNRPDKYYQAWVLEFEVAK